MTAIDPGMIEAAASSLYEGYKKKALRDHDWDPQNMAIAEGAANALRGSLQELSGGLQLDEVLVDYTYSQRHKAGLRGVNVTLTLLAATNRQFWYAVHSAGAVAEAAAIPFESLTPQKKSLTVTINVEQTGTGWTATGGKHLVEWIEGIKKDRPQQPVRLAKTALESAAKHAPAAAASASGSPAAWHPDPRGRHELRYWDGTGWTEHVSDRGVQSTDPV